MDPNRSGEITDLGDVARDALETQHQAREITLSTSRRAIRSCANAIRAVHRREFDDARTLIADAGALLAEADAARDGQGTGSSGSLHDAKKEFAEANLTLAFVSGEPMPGPDALAVSVPAYLNGMAEAASELRRQALDCLRCDEVAEAEALLAVMDDVYGLLVTIDYPDALTGGLRRSTDALRAVVERTRGDVTNALVAARVTDALEGGTGGRSG
jgi:translin